MMSCWLFVVILVYVYCVDCALVCGFDVVWYCCVYLWFVLVGFAACVW